MHIFCVNVVLFLVLSSFLFAQDNFNAGGFDDFNAKLAEAKKLNKPLLLYLVNEGCANSKKFDTDVMTKENAEKIFQPFILARINTSSDQAKSISTTYGWKNAPFMAILNKEGEAFKILDLSGIANDLINTNLAKQIEVWATSNAKRFANSDGLGYKQSEIAKDDPIRGIIEKWTSQKSAYSKAKKAYLLDSANLRITKEGRIIIRNHIIKYLGENSTTSIYEWSDVYKKTDTFKLISARTITSDFKQKIVDTSEVEETPLYSNYPSWDKVKTTKFVLPGVKDECFVEYEYEVQESLQMEKHFSFSWMIESENTPSLDSRLDVTIPEGIDLKYKIYKNTIPAKVEKSGGITHFTWNGSSQNYRNTDGDDIEPAISGYIILATKTEWEEIGRWFLSQADRARKHSKEMDDWADQIIKSITPGDNYEKRLTNAFLHAMYKEFRYLAINISSSGYQPHPTDEIFRNKYGDCKDLSLFLQEILKKAQIKSDLVLLKVSSMDVIREELPRVPYFTHCILRVKSGEQYFYVDPATFGFAAGTLSYQTCSLTGLVCEREKIFLQDITPATEIGSLQYDILIDDIVKEKVKVHLQIINKGTAKEIMRSAIDKLSDKEEKIFLKEIFTKLLPGKFFRDYSITKTDLSGDSENAETCEISYDGSLIRPFVNSENLIVANAFIPYINFGKGLPDYHPKNHEEKDRGFYTGWRIPSVSQKICYTIPKGLELKDHAKPIHVDNEYFKIDQDFEQKNDKLTITTRVEIKFIPGNMRYVRESELSPDARNVIENITKPIVFQRQSDSILCEACEKGDLQRAASLIETGADIEGTDSKGNTPLIIAAKYGRTDIVKYLLSKQCKIDASNPEGETALFIALNLGKADAGQILLDAGANYNTATRRGYTPLMAAACHKNELDILKYLINQKVEINVNSDEGPALAEAVLNNNNDAISPLIEAGADMYLVAAEKGFGNMIFPLLSLAARDGKIDIIKNLIAHKIDVNYPTRDGSTPLMIAARYNQLKAMEALLEGGAKIDIQREAGVTALIDAVIDNKLDTVKCLIDHKANLNLKDNEGYTALMSACHNENTNIIKALVEAGADINIENNNGTTASLILANCGNVDLLNYLKEKGAKQDDLHVIKNEKSKTPLPSAKAWAVASVAIYYQLKGGDTQYFHGYAQPDQESAKKWLLKHWSIKSKADLLSELQHLKDEGHRISYQQAGKKLADMKDDQFQQYITGSTINPGQIDRIKALRNYYLKWKDRTGLAWDWCRIINVAGYGYAARYITEKEAFDQIMPTAILLQKNFSSWEEMGSNFLDAREIWNDGKRAPNYDYCYKLLINAKDPYSPWNQIPWNTDLSDASKQ